MKTLVVLLGPTGVGKTELSLALAERLGSPVLSADSRQIFREIPIGTAAATPSEQRRVKHYFVGTHSVAEDYNAGMYERDALALMEGLFQSHDCLLMVGGSMMYIDAVCKGFDEMPAVSAELRQSVQTEYEEKGADWLRAEVERLDPVYYAEVDKQNPQRLLHALEICLASGRPYSDFRKSRPKGAVKERVLPNGERFRIVKIGLNRPREELYARINARVDVMMEQGLLEEVRNVLPLREKNSLNTVGYKELFRYLDGEWPLEKAVDMIRQDSRHYAKRQLTWFNADESIRWFHPDVAKIEDIIHIIDDKN